MYGLESLNTHNAVNCIGPWERRCIHLLFHPYTKSTVEGLPPLKYTRVHLHSWCTHNSARNNAGRWYQHLEQGHVDDNYSGFIAFLNKKSLKKIARDDFFVWPARNEISMEYQEWEHIQVLDAKLLEFFSGVRICYQDSGPVVASVHVCLWTNNNIGCKEWQCNFKGISFSSRVLITP